MWVETRKTMLFVTHDVGEAVELSNRIVILAKGGHLRQTSRWTCRSLAIPPTTAVALMKADVLRTFEELDLIAT